MTTCTLSFSFISAEKHVLGCRNSFRGSLVITVSHRNGERPRSLLLRNLVKTKKKLQTTAQSPYLVPPTNCSSGLSSSASVPLSKPFSVPTKRAFDIVVVPVIKLPH